MSSAQTTALSASNFHKYMSSSFKSHETGEAFTNCCDCGCALEEADLYIVNQSYAGDECVFEFAMCMSCRDAMNAKLSEDSRVAMFDFMHDNADMEAREKKLGENSETEKYIEHCLTCDQPRDQVKGYTAGALFQSSNLIKGLVPMIICDQCELKLAENISDETRDVWDKFIADNFPAPPSNVKLPKRRKPVII